MNQGWLTQSCAPFTALFTANLDAIQRHAREIRIRTGQPVTMTYRDTTALLLNGHTLLPTQIQVQALLLSFCQQALYAYEEQLAHGFITLCGGHRVGICGNAVVRAGKIERMHYVQGMNIRIARQLPIAPCAYAQVFPLGMARNTLIVSPPGFGKTTMLRELARHASNAGLQVSIADERGEIAACLHGVPQLDVGQNTDVLDQVPKIEAIPKLLRSMAPQVLVTDEIGDERDAQALLAAASAGVIILASAHVQDMRQIRAHFALRGLFENKLFARYLVLGNSPGNIVSVFDEEGRTC